MAGRQSVAQRRHQLLEREQVDAIANIHGCQILLHGCDRIVWCCAGSERARAPPEKPIAEREDGRGSPCPIRSCR